ncbi:MAG TPA: hypothetical protein VN652_00610 [Geobacteraceae bacterium]|nr:hypothetical protein [Geobacteraceae bacterium]
MLDRTKTILINGVFITALSILLFAADTQFRQWSQYSRGEKSLAAGDHINAVAGFESAIHMYTPLSPLVERSAARLWIIGRDMETRGEREKSLVAYRALRSAFYSTHGLTTPGLKWIALCDEKIKLLEPPIQPAR